MKAKILLFISVIISFAACERVKSVLPGDYAIFESYEKVNDSTHVYDGLWSGESAFQEPDGDIYTELVGFTIIAPVEREEYDMNRRWSKKELGKLIFSLGDSLDVSSDRIKFYNKK